MRYRLTFSDGSSAYLAHSILSVEALQERQYAFPDQRKFPLDTRQHVLSAIRFFNYVAPKDEKTLARAILRRMRELGITDVNVGDANRFKKYYKPDDGYLVHHGVKGMHWGVWNSETRARRNGGSGLKRRGFKSQLENSPGTLFVSGSSKTQFKESPYYRRKLPKEVRKELKSSMKSGDKIIVGDAPGIDRQVQDYLKKKRYANVEVYSPGTQTRYKAGKDWVNHFVNDTEHEPGSKEWLAKKDVAMTKNATKGLAVILDEGSTATRNNIARLDSQGKSSVVYQLDKRGKRYDRLVN